MKRRGNSPLLDRFDLYELCVTEPVRLARFLAAVHAGSPFTLREDFSGTGALARAWPGVITGGRSIAVDTDPEPLARCRGAPGVRTIVSDAARCRASADLVVATNFPIGYWHDRPSLVRYLRTVRASLRPGGVFVCDTYGGRDAMSRVTLTRRLRGPRGERIEQEWEQRDADPLTGMVTDVLHFRVKEAGASRDRVLRDGFVYRWRLWSIPELRETMAEAGLPAVEVYDRLGGALDGRGGLHVRPLEPGEELDENYVVYVAARRQGRGSRRGSRVR